MVQLSATLSQRANEVTKAIKARADALIQIAGDVGLGKTTFLLGLQERLEHAGLKPVLVTPPLRTDDAAPAALVQIADYLTDQHLLNGDRAVIENPHATLDDKLRVLERTIAKANGELVLLCDEPEQWLICEGTDENEDAFVRNRKEQVLAALWRWPCRRVFADRLPRPGRVPHLRQHWLKFDVVRFSEQRFQALSAAANEVHARLGAQLSVGSGLARRLLVGVAALSSVSAAGAFYQGFPDVWQIARRLLDLVSQDARLRPLRDLWARLALFRDAMSPDLIDNMGGKNLDGDCQAVLYESLLQPQGGSFVLHDVLRRFAALRVHQRPLEQAAHAAFAEIYARKMQNPVSGQLRSRLEGFYHAALAGRPDTQEVFPDLFPEQLHIWGRTRSKLYGDHPGAARIFQRAAKAYDTDDYAHHYWAYNADWDATDADLVEREYRRAVELNPGHAWWWSRLINFLITTGRLMDARQEWNRAHTALDVPDRGPADRVWWALHLWVARLLLHRGQVDFARFVLTDVPDETRTKDMSFLALWRLLQLLEEVDSGESVFPWTVPAETRWTSSYPHLPLPLDLDGAPLMRWNPARVLEVDRDRVWIIVGRRPAGDESGPVFGRVSVPRQLFDAASPAVPSSELESDRYLELGFYGDQEKLFVACYPPQVEMDKDLPGFDPPDPRRYLKKESI